MTDTPRYKIHQRLQLLAAAGTIANTHGNTALSNDRQAAGSFGEMYA